MRKCNIRVTVQLKEAVFLIINVYINLWYTRKKSPPILPTRNTMECQRESLNLGTITTRNLPDKYLI